MPPPSLELEPLTVVTSDAAATRSLGRALGRAIVAGSASSPPIPQPLAPKGDKGSREVAESVTVARGRILPAGSLVLLRGPLGAGKTTLAQGIAAGLGVVGPVTSPSFVLIREYEAAEGRRLVHMDFYRLSGAAEALDLGLEDYLSGSDIVVIEWPENAAGAVPREALSVALAYDADCRRVTLAAQGPVAQSALAALAIPAGVGKA